MRDGGSCGRGSAWADNKKLWEKPMKKSILLLFNKRYNELHRMYTASRFHGDGKEELPCVFILESRIWWQMD